MVPQFSETHVVRRVKGYLLPTFIKLSVPPNLGKIKFFYIFNNYQVW